MKRVIVFLLAAVAGWGLWAQEAQLLYWPNHIDTTENLLGRDVMVRYCESTYMTTYHPHDVICGYGYDPSMVTLDNQTTFLTNFLVRLSNESNRGLRRVAVLPEGYRVKDMEIAWILDDDSVRRPFCCFCGTMDSVFSYWTIARDEYDIPHRVDSTVCYGFVGAFSLTEAFAGSNVTVMLKLVEQSDSLCRMDVRSETGGPWHDASSAYRERVVMDAVGMLKSGSSCLTEVELYPSLGGNPAWDYQIDIPSDQTEMLVDVAQVQALMSSNELHREFPSRRLQEEDYPYDSDIVRVYRPNAVRTGAYCNFIINH